MSAFLKTTPGRLLTVSAGLTMLMGGIAAMLGPELGTPILCLALMVAVIGGLIAAGLASMEDLGTTLVLVLAYPFVLFGAIFGLAMAVKLQLTIAGFALVAVGLLAISATLLSRPSDRSHHGGVPRFAHRSA